MANIVLERFSKSFGATQILQEIDLEVQDGEFVVLLGPSGCGKSTLLRMIAGLEDISGGELFIGGERMTGRPARERNIAMVFQNYALYPHMTIRDNMAFGLRRLGLPRGEIDRRLAQTAGVLGLEPLLGRLPKQLSGGQQQRVAMGRAMVKTPKVFLFDEPLSNLDAKLRDQLRVEIKKLHRVIGTTTLFVTHDQLEAMTLADRIVVLKSGRIEQIGTPSEVYNRPVSVFVARFIGSPGINLLEGRVGEDRSTFEGRGLAVPLPTMLRDSLTPGRELLLGIRPRDVLAAKPGAPGAVLARVVLNEPMGAEALVQLALAGEEVSMLVDEAALPAPGAPMTVTFRPDRLHLFDRRSEQRILPAPADMVTEPLARRSS